MSTGRLPWTVLSFGFAYGLLWLVWRRRAARGADFERRRASVRRLRRYRARGIALVALVTAALAWFAGVGTGAARVAADHALLGAVVPPYLLRLGVVTYGPLLVGALAVHDAVAPYLDSLRRRPVTRTESLRAFLKLYALRTLPLFALLAVVHLVPDGPVAGLVVAAGVLAYGAAGPSVVRLLNDVRPLSADERAAVDGPDGVPVYVLETAGRQVRGLAVGFLPGHRAVFLTESVVEDLPAENLRAVLAHEYGHLRARTVLWFTVFRAASLGAGVWLWTAGVEVGLLGGGRSELLFWGAMGLCAYVVGRHRLRRREEFRADRFAAEQVGTTAMACALVALAEHDVSLAGPDHHRIDERIRRLDPSVVEDDPAGPTGN